MIKAVVTVVSAILLIQGCSGSSVKQPDPPGVTSSPSGATVYADGKELGKTPLYYDPIAAFPAGWTGGVYQAEGVLMVKKDGCEDFLLDVSDPILSKPIHAELKCGVMTDAEKPVIVETATEAAPKSTEQRLEELESLYKKGAITEEERKAVRERILDEL